MIVLEGDVLNSPFQLIAHQVNCRGVMGAGLAKQIRQKYPKLYKDYKEYCDRGANLGDCICNFTSDGHYILNIFAQYDYGRDKKYTNYEAMYQAFKKGIQEFRFDACEARTVAQLTIAIPYMIGCGLAGGDWGEVKIVLETIEKECNVVFIAYHL